MNHPRITAALLALSLAACGGKSLDANDTEPVGGGSAQGGSGNVAGLGGKAPVGGNQSGGAPGTGGSAGSPAQGGSPVDACEAFSDDTGALISVEIVNETSEVLYIGSAMATCGTISAFDVQDASATPLAIVADCRSPCDTVRHDGPVGCASLCQSPTAITLQPGASYPTIWSGLHYVQARLPAACVAQPNGGDRCDRAQRIEPGTFTFSAHAGSSLDCSAGGLANTCGCSPGPNGCVTNGALIGGELRTASTTVALDPSYGVSSKKAAPQPNDPPGQALIALIPVRIIFTD